jgi:hypothetical protein
VGRETVEEGEEPPTNVADTTHDRRPARPFSSTWPVQSALIRHLTREQAALRRGRRTDRPTHSTQDEHTLTSRIELVRPRRRRCASSSSASAALGRREARRARKRDVRLSAPLPSQTERERRLLCSTVVKTACIYTNMSFDRCQRHTSVRNQPPSAHFKRISAFECALSRLDARGACSCCARKLGALQLGRLKSLLRPLFVLHATVRQSSRAPLFGETSCGVHGNAVSAARLVCERGESVFPPAFARGEFVAAAY